MRATTAVDTILDEVVPKGPKELANFMLDLARLMLTDDRTPSGDKILLAAARIGMLIIKGRISHDLSLVRTDGTGKSGPGDTHESVGDTAVSD
jgi:hypothetical protein